MMFLIVGLGNPGEHYEKTRHNLGFMVIDEVSEILGARFITKRTYWIAETRYDDIEIVLLKPKTYMNLSGHAVKDTIDEYDVYLSKLLVICDDFNLPLGKIRIRGRGSDGGHNGLASVIHELNSTQFSRLRIGIGADFPKEKMVDYVLMPFTNSEKEILNKTIKLAGQAVMSFVSKGLLLTMNEYNGIS